MKKIFFLFCLTLILNSNLKSDITIIHEIEEPISSILFYYLLPQYEKHEGKIVPEMIACTIVSSFYDPSFISTRFPTNGKRWNIKINIGDIILEKRNLIDGKTYILRKGSIRIETPFGETSKKRKTAKSQYELIEQAE